MGIKDRCYRHIPQCKTIGNEINPKNKIKEGLIDIDNTKFNWKDYAKFKILDSLIHVKNSELVLDGKLEIIIKDSQEIYKTLLTPKNYRTEIEKIELNFNYNFDQKILKLNDIRVDNVINKNVGNILKNLIVTLCIGKPFLHTKCITLPKLQLDTIKKF